MAVVPARSYAAEAAAPEMLINRDMAGVFLSRDNRSTWSRLSIASKHASSQV
jgi:hypothetical protein